MTTLRLKLLWRDDRRLRRCLLVVDVGLIAVWLYLIAYVFAHPADRGSDGFEVLLIVPVTAIAFCLSLPALLLLISDRTLRAGAWVTLAAIVANVLMWNTIRWHSGLGREWHCATFWTLCW